MLDLFTGYCSDQRPLGVTFEDAQRRRNASVGTLGAVFRGVRGESCTTTDLCPNCACSVSARSAGKSAPGDVVVLGAMSGLNHLMPGTPVEET